MNEDPTQDIPQKYDTKPTLETVLERIDALSNEMRSEMKELRAEMNQRFDGVERRLDMVDDRLGDISAKVKLLNRDALQVRAAS